MNERVGFGPWRPDLHPLTVGSRGVVEAEGVVPAADGYRSFPGWTQMAVGTSVVTTLDARPRGSAIGGTKSDGTPFHFAGDDEKLYELQTGGFTDVSRAGSPAYSLGSVDRWEWEQYGDTILAAGLHSAPLQKFLMGTDSAFADVSGAPNAKHIAVIAHQVFLGNLSTDPAAIHWGAIDNPTSWPTLGTDAAQAVLSGAQSLQRGGTEVRGLTAYGEVGGIFKEGSIWRADFAGGEIQWELHPMIENVGLLAHGMAIPFAGEVLFPSLRGWFVWSYGNGLRPVGDQVLDAWFKADLDMANLNRMSWALDPDAQVAAILYPGQGSVDGAPNRILLHHFQLNRWSLVSDLGLEMLANAVQPAVSLTLETIPQIPLNESQGSFDDPTSPVSVHFGAFDQESDELGLFEGAAVPVELVTGEIQHAASAGAGGRRSVVTGVRPMVDTDPEHKATVAIGTRDTRYEAVTFTGDLAQDDEADGQCQDVVEGRYHSYRLRVPEGATQMRAMGLEIEYQPAGDV